MERHGNIFIVIAVAVSFLGIQNAWAVNGHQFTGNGSIQESMNGAGSAAPLDSATILLNPAGLVRVPNRFDFSIAMGIPIAHMDSSAAPAGNPAAGNQKNEIDVFPIPAISSSFELIKDKLAFGLGLFGVAGNAFSFKQSRINPALSHNAYDRYIDYRVFKFTPAISYAILDNLSIGAAFHTNYAIFGTDSAVGGTLAETAGAARTENALGFGGSFGILYSPIHELSLGTCYTSRQLFPKFKKYPDLFKNSLDMPHQLKVGIAGKPFDMWLLALDFHWINWSGISTYGNTPEKGGLGWRDQYIIDFGTQVSVGPKDKVHLRLGYGYGKPPVRSDVTFANALLPLISKHSFAMGFGVDLNDHWTINAHYGVNVINKMTDSGTGDAISKAGAGTKVDLMIHTASAGLSYRWDRVTTNPPQEVTPVPEME